MSGAGCSARSRWPAPSSRCATTRPAAGTSSRPPACGACTRSRSCTAPPVSAQPTDRDHQQHVSPRPLMVGLIIVSHSATLAAGVVELARQMGGEDVAIEPAGGMADPPGEIGTDMQVVMGAIERAASPDGVLVLMDLGSAVMSAEMAVEMLPDARVLLCEAPLVEGAVAAAARARTGASLEEVATEARAALGMKAAQLGVEEPAAAAAPAGVDAS